MMAEVESSSLVSQHPKQQILFNQQLPVPAKISKYPLSYWYGSDAEEDTDDDEEEDTDDEEEEEEEEWMKQKLDLTKPYQYRRDIRSVDDVLKEHAYNKIRGRLFSQKGSTTLTTQPPPEPLPLPPPPSPPPSLNVQQSLPLPPQPSPLSSLSLRELVKLLGEALAKLRDPSASGLESQTEALHPVSKKPRLVPA